MDGQKREQVGKFKYLGSWITDDGRCKVKLKLKIAMAKQAFNNRRELLTRTLKLNLKRKLVKTLIWIVLLYGAETWSLRKVDKTRLKAFEMWAWRKLKKNFMDRSCKKCGGAKKSWREKIADEDNN